MAQTSGRATDLDVISHGASVWLLGIDVESRERVHVAKKFARITQSSSCQCRIVLVDVHRAPLRVLPALHVSPVRNCFVPPVRR